MKKLQIFLLFTILTLSFFSNLTVAEIITHIVTFNKSDLRFSKLNNYDVVTIKGFEVCYDIGSPQLPCYLINFIIPEGESIDHVEIIDSKTELLEGVYYILPVQKPEILSSVMIGNKKIRFTQPNSTIYSSSNYYPQEVITILGNNYLGHLNIATVQINPLQYHPAKRKLKFYSDITFQIITQPDGAKLSKKWSPTNSQSRVLKNLAEKLVVNLNQIKWINSVNQNIELINPEEEYQYLIITCNALASDFKPLSDWKHKKGLPSKIVTVEWIYDNYQGIDRQEKIRNFIKYAYENWGTIWILLGGDTNIIPHRTAFAMNCEFGADPRENDIPCDLYYADLDGSWNEDSNNIYGEMTDKVDLYPEVFIGRAPVEDAAEADIFVNKILTYEKDPPLDYQRDILFAAEILWADPYTNTGLAKDMIEEKYLPDRFYNITKLYEDWANESIASVRNAINEGQNIINHHGHASANVMGMGDGYFRKSDMQDLVNGSKQSILYSIGCYPANFEADCIAEAFLNNPNGGGVAFIGNSRYGWGSPGNPGYGYSDRYDDQFFRFLFKEKNYNLGKALTLAKAYYVPYARQENVYRWCMYEINLLGDPEMPIWTDIPDTVTVYYPPSITTGNCSVHITVTAHGLPIRDALVCVMHGDDVYQFGRTNDEGQIVFSISPTNPSNQLLLTVTAPNFLPYESSIDVISQTEYIVCSKLMVEDSQGNNDSLINPGETICLKTRFKNFGNLNATGVTAVITSSDSLIFIADGNINVGDIAGYDSVESSDMFVLSVDSSCKNGHVFHLNMTISANGDMEWKQVLSLTGARPVLCFEFHKIDDSMFGNSNGVPEPGERIKLVTAIRNEGLAPAKSVQSVLTTNDQNIDIEQNIGYFGDVSSNETSIDSFVIDIANTYSNLPAFPNFEMNFKTDEGYLFSLSFKLTIGKTGFQDDMEDGVGGWQVFNPASNHWHISSLERHSGSFAWYCGDETTGKYFQNDESILESPLFYLGQDAQLSFWAWYNVAIYGVNGFYVNFSVDSGNTWQKLDFIGSGGALDSALMGNDWLPYTYDLSDFEPGALAKVQFHWVSDNDSLPMGIISGVFIDDVMITSRLTISVANEGGNPLPVPTKHRLAQNYPNPFNLFTRINYEITGNSFQNVEIIIYNLLGQKVKTLVNHKNTGGYYTVLWDGTNEYEELAGSGIYIYQLKVADFRMEKKLILLR